jgi:hypothetical protein
MMSFAAAVVSEVSTGKGFVEVRAHGHTCVARLCSAAYVLTTDGALPVSTCCCCCRTLACRRRRRRWRSS